MPTVYFIDADGNQFEAEAEAGTNVMEVAVDNFIDGIVGECGGVLSCATCHCYVDEKWLDKLEPASEQEGLWGSDSIAASATEVSALQRS